MLRNSDGCDLPSYFSGTSGLKFFVLGHWTCRSSHHAGVDAKERRRMRLAVVLLWHVWLEILRVGPLDLPQLTSERRATYRVRQVAWFPWRMHVDRGPGALVRLTPRFSLALDASTSVFLLSFVKNLALIATSSWI